MSAIYFCAHCLKKISHVQEQFLLICDFYCDIGEPIQLGLDGIDAKEVRLFMHAVHELERQGCVISTETGQFLVSVKPIGFDLVPENALIRESRKPVWCIDRAHEHAPI